MNVYFKITCIDAEERKKNELAGGKTEVKDDSVEEKPNTETDDKQKNEESDKKKEEDKKSKGKPGAPTVSKK